MQVNEEKKSRKGAVEKYLKRQLVYFTSSCLIKTNEIEMRKYNLIY